MITAKDKNEAGRGIVLARVGEKRRCLGLVSSEGLTEKVTAITASLTHGNSAMF